MEWNFPIAAVMHDERRHSQPGNPLENLHVLQCDARLPFHTCLEGAHCLTLKVGEVPEARDDICHRRGRPNQHHTAGRETALDGEGGDDAAKRVRYDAGERAEILRDLAQCLRALDQIRLTAARVTVCREVEGNDTKTGPHERLDEAPQLSTAS